MTNAPNRYEKFVVPEGTKKISYVKDTKIVNAARFVIEREDHTAGNLLRMELFRDPDVVFSGYRVPHPLDPRIWLQSVPGMEALVAAKCLRTVSIRRAHTHWPKVQTNNNSTPIEAVDTAMTELLEEYRAMKIAWTEEVEKARVY